MYKADFVPTPDLLSFLQIAITVTIKIPSFLAQDSVLKQLIYRLIICEYLITTLDFIYSTV